MLKGDKKLGDRKCFLLYETRNIQGYKRYSSAQTTIMDKNTWDSSAIFVFFCHSGFPHKTVHPFRNFLAVLPPPTLCKVETRKKFWIHASNIDCGLRGGVGPVLIGKRPEIQVSLDFCPWLFEKEVGGKKSILSGFQACKSFLGGFWWKMAIEKSNELLKLWCTG